MTFSNVAETLEGSKMNLKAKTDTGKVIFYFLQQFCSCFTI